MQSRTLSLAVGALSLLLSRLAGAQDYSWTEIVVPGATVLQAFGLNDKGQTALITTIGPGIYGNGTFTPLPPPPEGLQVSALGINNDGVITGRAFPMGQTGPDQGFILRESTYTLFSRPDWENTDPRAIANSGLITGYNFGGGRFAGFIYDPDSKTFTDATPPRSVNTITQGMNKFGRITGHGTDTYARYGFVWQQGTINKGKRELLPFFDRIEIGFSTNARGINDSGAVVGFIAEAGGRSDGFVGSDAGGYQRLVAPGGEKGGNSTFCAGINNLAQVVCYVWDFAANPLGAFIGSPPTALGDTDEAIEGLHIVQ